MQEILSKPSELGNPKIKHIHSYFSHYQHAIAFLYNINKWLVKVITCTVKMKLTAMLRAFIKVTTLIYKRNYPGLTTYPR